MFEQAAQGRHPGHGLVLQARAYQPLLGLLGIGEPAFRKAVAVDAAIGRNGAVKDSAYTDERLNEKLQPLIRVNKRKLRDLLAEGVEIRWDHRLKTIHASQDSVKAEFENGQTVDGSLLIAADGVHSVGKAWMNVTELYKAEDALLTARKQVLPDVKPSVLRYVAINGQRRVPKDQFDSTFLPAMAESSAVSTSMGDATLAIAINDATEETVSLSYTYSRPAREKDALYKPDRSTDDAKIIPEEFYQELEAFAQAKLPFSEIASPAKAREDRLLSWLMRSVKLSDEDLVALPPRVGLLGDAAHAMPIVVSLTSALHQQRS